MAENGRHHGERQAAAEASRSRPPSERSRVDCRQQVWVQNKGQGSAGWCRGRGRAEGRVVGRCGLWWGGRCRVVAGASAVMVTVRRRKHGTARPMPCAARRWCCLPAVAATYGNGTRVGTAVWWKRWGGMVGNNGTGRNAGNVRRQWYTGAAWICSETAGGPVFWGGVVACPRPRHSDTATSLPVDACLYRPRTRICAEYPARPAVARPL